VSQIARTIAKVLRLHEELTEAIALGHDLGHPPFGHAGERVIGQLMPGGFNHSEQSLRIIDVLENDGRGLNLTWEVRNGIAKHSKGKSGAPVGMGPAARRHRRGADHARRRSDRTSTTTSTMPARDLRPRSAAPRSKRSAPPSARIGTLVATSQETLKGGLAENR
jgi:dGTP triphosphohydrolase